LPRRHRSPEYELRTSDGDTASRRAGEIDLVRASSEIPSASACLWLPCRSGRRPEQAGRLRKHHIARAWALARPNLDVRHFPLEAGHRLRVHGPRDEHIEAVTAICDSLNGTDMSALAHRRPTAALRERTRRGDGIAAVAVPRRGRCPPRPAMRPPLAFGRIDAGAPSLARAPAPD